MVFVTNGKSMARKRNVIGESFGKSILDRSDVLQKQAASHGDVFSGGLADQALDAIGARAMTMNGEIIVNSNFDLSDAGDQAEYAHELYHQARSGGAAGDKIRDAEEIAARAIESMVFHEAGGGWTQTPKRAKHHARPVDYRAAATTCRGRVAKFQL